MSLVALCSLYLPKSLNFINAFACHKQKCKLAPFNLAHPVSAGNSVSVPQYTAVPLFYTDWCLLFLFFFLLFTGNKWDGRIIPCKNSKRKCAWSTWFVCWRRIVSNWRVGSNEHGENRRLTTNSTTEQHQRWKRYMKWTKHVVVAAAAASALVATDITSNVATSTREHVSCSRFPRQLCHETRYANGALKLG